MASEPKFLKAKDKIENEVIKLAKQYDLEPYQLIRILALLTNEVAHSARIDEVAEKI